MPFASRHFGRQRTDYSYLGQNWLVVFKDTKPLKLCFSQVEKSKKNPWAFPYRVKSSFSLQSVTE